MFLAQALLQEYSLSHVKHFTPCDLDKSIVFLFVSSTGYADFKCICLQATQGVDTDMVRIKDSWFLCHKIADSSPSGCVH